MDTNNSKSCAIHVMRKNREGMEMQRGMDGNH
jgi:hypothetical protein